MDLTEEPGGELLGMVNMAMSSTEDHKRFIKFCYMIFTAADKKSWAAEAEQILQDHSLMKKIGYLGAVKENQETRTLYYGSDKGINDPLGYREEDETLVTEVEMRFLRYLGIILREQTEEKEFEL